MNVRQIVIQGDKDQYVAHDYTEKYIRSVLDLEEQEQTRLDKQQGEKSPSGYFHSILYLVYPNIGR